MRSNGGITSVYRVLGRPGSCSSARRFTSRNAANTSTHMLGKRRRADFEGGLEAPGVLMPGVAELIPATIDWPAQAGTRAHFQGLARMTRMP